MLFDLSDQHYAFDPFSMHFFASPRNPVPAIGQQDLAPEYVSRLLHEVTHLDCMRTDLGTALVIGMLWLRNRFLVVGADDPVLTSDGHTIPDPRTGKNILARPLLVRKILCGFAETTVTLEGLAMFAQLDLRFSSNEASSLQFRATLALLGQAGAESAASLSSAMVSRYHDAVREHAIFEERLLDRLLFGVDRRNSYYLFGYLFVKSLAFILREREPLFRDPEMAYLFLKGFLLNGAGYVNKDVLGPGEVTTQLQGRVGLLLNAPRVRLRAAYEALSTDTKDHLTGFDWANFLDSGTARSATGEAQLRTALGAMGVNHDDLMRLIVSMDFVPLKMVPAWIVGYITAGDHVQLVIVSGIGELVAECAKWVRRDDFLLVQEEATRTGKSIPLVTDIPSLETAAESIGDPNRLGVLWTSAFVVETLAPLSLWSFRGAVFSEDNAGLTLLRDSACTYLNFFERRKFADFIFDVVGSRVPSAGGLIHNFSLFVYQHFMKIEGGRKFERLLDHGFSIMSGSKASATSGDSLSATVREQINHLLVYPVFDEWRSP